MKRLFGVVIAMAFAAACGGGGTSPSAASQPASAAVTSAPTSAATTAASPSTQTGRSFLDLVKQGKLTAYKVSYKYTIAAGGQSLEGVQTWYYKPPKARYDYSVGGAGGGTFSFFKLEDAAYFCTNAGGTSFCQKIPGGGVQGNAAADFDLQVGTTPDQFSATSTSSRTIAGQQAQCFAVKATAGAGDVNGCYSSSGIPLFMQFASPQGSSTMEATSFSTTVSDDDFKLPGPVR